MSGEVGAAARVGTPSGDPIMTAKFRVPTARTPLVARERLLTTMSRGADGALTLVSAPAGSGKTALVASWVAAGRSPGPVVWISLDDDDAQPGMFWSYLIAGLAHTGVAVAALAPPSRPEAVEHSLLVRLAASLADRTEPVVVVLDNAEALTDPAVPAGIDFLLRHSGPQLRIVMVTRVDPALALHRHRLAGTVTEIRLADLAFTAGEAEQLLASHDLHLPRGAAAALAERTGGWAAALCLSAPAPPRGPGAAGAADAPIDADGDLAAYFVAEFLDAQPPEVRGLLLRTSVAERVWPTLAVALTGQRDATRTLSGLAHAHGFVAPSATDPGSYEYHPLVRDLLRNRLRQEAPGSLRRLHRRAARWFAAENMLAEAVEHASAADEWRYAATLVVDRLAIGSLLAGRAGERMVTGFAGMPPEVPGPEAAVVQAALALAHGDADLGAKQLTRAQELVGVGCTARPSALRLTIAVAEAACALARHDTDGAPAAAEAALAALGEIPAIGGRVPADLHALLLGTCGGALLRAGRHDEAAGALTDGARLATEAGHDGLRAGCLGELALIHAIGGRLRQARRCAQQAEATADERRTPVEERPPAAAVALAWAHAEAYEITAARGYADRAARSRGIADDPVPAGALALVRARLHRARGDLDGAIAVLDALPPAGLPEWLRHRLAAARAQHRMACGGADAAAVVMTSAGLAAAAGLASPVARTPHGALVLAAARLAADDTDAARDLAAAVTGRADAPLDARVGGWLLTADCELARDLPARGREALDRALALAAPERLRRPVIETSSRVRRLLRQERALADRHRWLSDSTVEATAPAAGPAEASSAGPLVEPLTEKEAEVLRHLAALLCTEEIARTMFISVNTVKTHIRGIFRKLAVSRRNDAIRRARGLGLL